MSEEQKAKKAVFKQWWFWVAVVIGFIVLANVCTRSTGTVTQATSVPPESAVEATTTPTEAPTAEPTAEPTQKVISVQEYFEKNMKLSGKQVIISGPVVEAEKAMDGTFRIKIGSGENTIQCYSPMGSFVRIHKAELDGIKIGQTVTLTGTFAQENPFKIFTYVEFK